MTGTCGGCTHWIAPTVTREPNDFGLCRKSTQSPIEDGVEFYAIDGEAYGAELRTRPTFGCNQWFPSEPFTVVATSDPHGFIVGGITVHDFANDPDFHGERTDDRWGYYLPGPVGWVTGFATREDAARAGITAVLGR